MNESRSQGGRHDHWRRPARQLRGHDHVCVLASPRIMTVGCIVCRTQGKMKMQGSFLKFKFKEFQDGDNRALNHTQGSVKYKSTVRTPTQLRPDDGEGTGESNSDPGTGIFREGGAISEGGGPGGARRTSSSPAGPGFHLRSLQGERYPGFPLECEVRGKFREVKFTVDFVD